MNKPTQYATDAVATLLKSNQEATMKDTKKPNFNDLVKNTPPGAGKTGSLKPKLTYVDNPYPDNPEVEFEDAAKTKAAIEAMKPMNVFKTKVSDAIARTKEWAKQEPNTVMIVLVLILGALAIYAVLTYESNQASLRTAATPVAVDTLYDFYITSEGLVEPASYNCDFSTLTHSMSGNRILSLDGSVIQCKGSVKLTIAQANAYDYRAAFEEFTSLVKP